MGPSSCPRERLFLLSNLHRDFLVGSAVSGPQDGVGEVEEVSLDFESFLHTNGTLYSCFNHHGNRVYVDETQVRTWPPGGRFLYCVTPAISS